MLDFVRLDLHVWKKLRLHSSQGIAVYMALCFNSNLFTCISYPLTVVQIGKYAAIRDTSAIYKELRELVKTGLLEKVKSSRGVLQYKFVLHTPKYKKGVYNEVSTEASSVL